MDLAAATSWRDQILRSEGLPEDERPRFLLILGDLHEVSLELQHVLAACALVGRLQCPDRAGFRSYAEKVVRAELATAAVRPHALYYTAEDGSLAIELGRDLLIDPCFTRTLEGTQTGRLALADVLEVPHGDGQSAERLRLAGATEHALLLSLSHGLGAPRKGWRSPEEQRARQGALFLGVEELTAETLVNVPFLPDGVWFSLAWFSAGTPSASAFHSWLTALAAAGSSPMLMLSWSRMDPERRIGFAGGRFTSPNKWLSFLVGLALTVFFYLPLHLGLAPDWFNEMFTKRGPCCYPTMFLFFWALAMLMMKWRKFALQERALKLPVMPQQHDFELTPSTARALRERMSAIVDDPHHFILLNRIDLALANLHDIGHIPLLWPQF